MLNSQKELTDQFTATDDQGNTYIVLQYTNFIEASHQELRGLNEFFLQDGTRLNAHGDGKYSTVDRPPLMLHRQQNQANNP